MLNKNETTVWKYILLSANAVTNLRMPVGAKILSVNEQRGQVCMWAQVDPSAEKIVRNFVLLGTGFTLPRGAVFSFVGTVVQEIRNTAIHVFEVEG